MKKVFYWCPFITKVATVKAVINSCIGLNKHSKLFKPYIINCFGEFDEYIEEISNNKISIINLNNNKFIKRFPSQGYLFSRIKYILIFFFLKLFSNLVYYLIYIFLIIFHFMDNLFNNINILLYR